MADEQIRIDVTARDDASSTLEDVADEARELEDLTPEVTVDADTAGADRKLEDVADAARELERQTPELTVTADVDQAERGIRDVREDVERLSREDTEILLRAKIDDARGQLKTLRTDLEQTGDKAQDTARQMDRLGGDGGLQTRGNAIADLTGPLGDASGAASDFAGVFDGLGDIAEDVAGKVGLNAAAMSTAIGGIGIAVAAAAAVWTIFSQRQEKARQRQRELVEGQERINEAIEAGDRAAAASELVDLYRDAYDAAEQAGIAADDLTRFITGQTTALDGLTEAEHRWNQSLGDGFGNQELALRYFDELIGTVKGAREQYTETNGTLAEQRARLGDVTGALGGLSSSTDDATTRQQRLERQADRTRDAFDRIRGSLDMESAFIRFGEQMAGAMQRAQDGAGNTATEILDLKTAILDVAEYAKLTPVQVRSLLEKVDQGDLAGVRADVEWYYANAPVSIHTRLLPPTQAAINGFVGAVQGAVGTITVPGRVSFAGVSGAVYAGPRG